MILFRRLELKYLVDRTSRTALEKDLRTFTPADGYSESNEGYLVRSLYFDTHDYMAYHEKMAGTAVRHKLRMRVYGEKPEMAPFVRLEVKSRYNETINKITVDVPQKDFDDVASAIENHRLPPQHFLNLDGISREFFRVQRQYNMKPQIMVQYRRRAYEKKEIERVRVNFDDQLFATKHLDILGHLRCARSLLKYGNSIFEIKVDGTMPYWLHKLIAKYDLQNQAISKYCYAIRGQARLTTHSRSEE